MATSNNFNRTSNSFSGVDIKAVFHNTTIGELQGISYSISREKAPVFTMGDPNPRSFSRGKRAIGGALVFVTFDRSPLIHAMREIGVKFLSDVDEFRPNLPLGVYGDSVLENQTTLSGTIGSASGGFDEVPAAEQNLSNVFSDQQLSLPWTADQIPPFDITLVGNNEYGASIKMAVIGVELGNEGGGISVDDIHIENQYTYMARAIYPWTRVANPNARLVGVPTNV